MRAGLSLLMLGIISLAPAADPAPVDEPPLTAKDRNHWAFKPPVRPKAPTVHEPAWVRNPVDAFILARLGKEGLHPSPRADKRTLLRRASFDLTGLPPTLKEIDDFLGDTSADAYDKVVDRLLSSPRYGERMVLEWLDADTEHRTRIRRAARERAVAEFTFEGERRQLQSVLDQLMPRRW